MKRFLPPGIWDNPRAEEALAYNEFVLAYLANDEQAKKHYWKYEQDNHPDVNLRALAYTYSEVMSGGVKVNGRASHHMYENFGLETWWVNGLPAPIQYKVSQFNLGKESRWQDGLPSIIQRQGGAETYTNTPSGGIKTNGAPVANVRYTVTPSGGTRADGVPVANVRYTVTPSGGTKANGTATRTHFDIAEVSGGAKLNGAAFVEIKGRYNEVMSGGMKAAGTTLTTFTDIVEVSGGAKLNGAPVINVRYTVTPSGGTKANGTATRTHFDIAEVSGGAKLSGAPVANVRYTVIPSGGTKTSGTAFVETKGTHNEVMSGGMKAAGTTLTTFTDIVEVSGGAKLNGTPVSYFSYNVTNVAWPPTGGVTVNNERPISSGLIVHLDAGNQYSEPTTNEFIGSTWSGDGAAQGGLGAVGAVVITDPGLKYNGYDTVLWTPGNSYNCYLHGDGSDVSYSRTSTDWTFSCYIRREDGGLLAGGSNNVSIYMYYPSSDGSAVATVQTLGNGWYRISRTRTGSNNYLSLVGITSLAAGYKFYLSGWQIEKKEHPTPAITINTSRNWIDLAGGNNNGTLTGGPTFNVANDGAVVFDGTDDYVECGSVGNTAPTSYVTWFHVTSLPADSRVIFSDNSNKAGLGFYNNDRLIICSGGAGDTQRTASREGLAAGWNSIAITYDASKVPTCYINGNPVSTYLANEYWSNVNNTLLIGGRMASAGVISTCFAGRVAIVEVYDRALTAAEVKLIFDESRERFDQRRNIADIKTTYTAITSGGVKTNGTSNVSFHGAIQSSGGTKANGTAVNTIYDNHVASGGVKLAGIATVEERGTYHEVMSGGMKANGSATQLLRYIPPISGGAKLNSTATKTSTKTWNGSTSSWNTAGNWRPSGVPTSEDMVVFNATSTVSCTLDVALSCASLTATAAYSGTLDLADSAYSHNVYGDVTLDCNTFDMGNSTLTVAGNFDNVDLTTFTPATSTLVLTGSGKTFSSIADSPTSRRWYRLTFDTGSSYTISGNLVRAVNRITINGSVNISGTTLDAYASCEVIFGSAGSASGNRLSLTDCATGYGLITFPATAHITTTYLSFYTGWGVICSFPPGTYEASNVEISNSTANTRTCTLANGTYTFTGHVLYANTGSGSLTISNTNNPSFVYYRDLTFTQTNGTLTYTKGTGSNTLLGGNTQTITLFGMALENFTRSGKTGGSIVIWMSDPVYGKGRLGGTISNVAVYNHTTSGGTKANGSAANTIYDYHTPSGGVKLNGTAYTAFRDIVEVSGGAKTNGSAIVSVIYNPVRNLGPGLLNINTWTEGTGGATGFGPNGLTAENVRSVAADPFGDQRVIWEAVPSGDWGADGGWATDNFVIDNTKMYRFSVWVNKTVYGSDGTFYFGTYGRNSSGTETPIVRRDTGATTTNPYFWSTATPTATDTWTLIVGHIWPYGTGTGSSHPDSGRYTIAGGKLGSISVDYIWSSDHARSNHRTYLYYTYDTTVRQRWIYPRVDIIDGTEPSIQDLLNNVNAPNVSLGGSATVTSSDIVEVGGGGVKVGGAAYALRNRRYWVGTSTSWNDANNWSDTSGGPGGFPVPTINDRVYFDGNGVYNCTLANSVNVKTLDMNCDTYTGTFTDAGYTLTAYGNLRIYTISNVVDRSNLTGVLRIAANGQLTVNRDANIGYRVEIASGVSVDNTGLSTNYGDWCMAKKIVVEAGATVANTTLTIWANYENTPLDISATATIASSTVIRYYSLNASYNQQGGYTTQGDIFLNYGAVTLLQTGNISCRNLTIYGGGASVNYWDTNGSNLTISSNLTLGLSTGSTPDYYRGGIYFRTGTHSIAGILQSGGQYTRGYIYFGSANVSVGGNLDFRYCTISDAGSAILTLNGTGTQNVYGDSVTICNLVINKSAGQATFQSALGCIGFTGTDGDCDLNGVTLTASGNVTINKPAGFRFWDGSTASMSDAVIDYDGDLTLTGVNGDMLYITDLDFVNTVADTPVATYCYVTNSIRTGTGIDIYALSTPFGGTNTNNGGNTGWNFGVAINEIMSGGIKGNGSAGYGIQYINAMSYGVKLNGTHILSTVKDPLAVVTGMAVIPLPKTQNRKPTCKPNVKSSQFKGLVAWWINGEPGGNKVYDPVGNNTGVAKPNGSWVVNGTRGGFVYELDGSTEHINCGSGKQLHFYGSDMSISLWAKPDSYPGSGYEVLLSKPTDYEIAIDSAGHVCYHFKSAAWTDSGRVLSTTSWTLITLVRKNGSNTLYLNGEAS